MKIRQGFVSNSSSSSFICSVCDKVHFVMDGDIENDCNLASCKNNHTFCMSHVKKNGFMKHIEKIIEKNNDYLKFKKEIEGIDFKGEFRPLKFKKDFIKIIKKDKSYLFFEIIDFLCKISNNIPSKLCPICNFETILDCDILEWINNNPELKCNIINDIKNECKGDYNILKNIKLKDVKNED